MTQRTTVSDDLREGVLLQPAEELRPDLVAGGEEEEVEEDRSSRAGSTVDVELADDDAGEQRPDDVAEA